MYIHCNNILYISRYTLQFIDSCVSRSSLLSLYPPKLPMSQRRKRRRNGMKKWRRRRRWCAEVSPYYPQLQSTAHHHSLAWLPDKWEEARTCPQRTNQGDNRSPQRSSGREGQKVGSNLTNLWEDAGTSRWSLNVTHCCEVVVFHLACCSPLTQLLLYLQMDRGHDCNTCRATTSRPEI